MKSVTKYINLAKFFSTWSKDPRTKVGAVIIGEYDQVLSQGYNGFPRGLADTEERLHDRQLKNKLVVHAETNALYNALRNGVNLNNAVMYVYGLECCHECAKAIVQSGIRTVYVHNSIPNKDWQESTNLAKDIFTECGVNYAFVDIPQLNDC
jgi:dCMP deaminase